MGQDLVDDDFNESGMNEDLYLFKYLLFSSLNDVLLVHPGRGECKIVAYGEI